MGIDDQAMSSATGRYHRFCRALKHARLMAGLRQLDVAEALGRPQSFVAKVESGERQLDFIETLDYCSVLGIAAEDLIQVVAKGVSVSILSNGVGQENDAR